VRLHLRDNQATLRWAIFIWATVTWASLNERSSTQCVLEMSNHQPNAFCILNWRKISEKNQFFSTINFLIDWWIAP
jgi:hypothetical protein